MVYHSLHVPNCRSVIPKEILFVSKIAGYLIFKADDMKYGIIYKEKCFVAEQLFLMMSPQTFRLFAKAVYAASLNNPLWI